MVAFIVIPHREVFRFTAFLMAIMMMSSQLFLLSQTETRPGCFL